MRATALLAVLLLGPGCAAGHAPAAARTPSGAALADLPPPGVVDAAQARRLRAAGVRVVDVHTPEEYAAEPPPAGGVICAGRLRPC